MNLFFNIIMLICMYPVTFIMYFTMTLSGRAAGNRLFGIRYQDDWLPAGEVHERERVFMRKMRIRLIILMAVPITAFLPTYMSVSYTIWIMWLLAVIAVFWLQCAKSYNELLSLKEERAGRAEKPETVYHELKCTQIHCIKWYDLLIPLLISLLAAAFPYLYLKGERQESYGLLMIIIALCNICLYASAVWTDHMKINVISDNSDINANYARALKKLWKQFWMAGIWTSTVYTLLILISLLPGIYTAQLASRAILWGSMATGLTLVVLCIYLIKRKRKLDEYYYDKVDIRMNASLDEEERRWVGGILYYNPDNRHSFVDTKFGVGTTFNMARPAGKIIMGFTILAILALPVSCVWLMLEEFTPLSLSIQNDRLSAVHLGEDYSVPLEDIKDVTLLTELPRSTKVHGTNSSVLEKGLFRNSTDGKVQKFLNPQNGVFLRIETSEAVYYMSGQNDEETLAIYHSLSRTASGTAEEIP